MKLFYCIISFYLLYQSSLLHASEFSSDPPVKDSDMLCPFRIEVYPKEFHAGDVVYVRLNFENTTDHPVWAPALPLNARLEQGILVYFFEYFADGKGNEYFWKRYLLGDGIGQGIWEKILPGQKGLIQYEMIEYGRTRNLKCWNEMKTNGTWGRLMVMLNFTGYSHRKTNAPVPQVIVVFPSLDIKPRPQKEMELIEHFMSSEKYRIAGGMVVVPVQISESMKDYQDKCATVEEMQEFCDQISQGTLKNFIQYQTFLLELVFQIFDKNETEQIKIIEKIGKWLETLPELEQENLKIYARYLKEHLRLQKHPEKLIERLTSVFGDSPPMPEELIMK